MQADDFFNMVFGQEAMTFAKKSGVMAALRVKAKEADRVTCAFRIDSEEFHQFAIGLAEGFTAWKERVPA